MSEYIDLLNVVRNESIDSLGKIKRSKKLMCDVTGVNDNMKSSRSGKRSAQVRRIRRIYGTEEEMKFVYKFTPQWRTERARRKILNLSRIKIKFLIIERVYPLQCRSERSGRSCDIKY